MYSLTVGRRHPGAGSYLSAHTDENCRYGGMSMKICTILDCKNENLAKGYCKKHYSRFHKHGDPLHISREYHGMNRSSEYMAWAAMKKRCSNKNDPKYKYYGERGITVCVRWKNSFIAFYKDMGPKPFSKAQIDRIDNDGNYTSHNCRWTTSTQNQQNKSNNRLTMEKAKAIRRRYRSENITQRKLAWIYGVCTMTINYVVNQKRWVE